MSSKRILIFGCSGHGHSVIEAAEHGPDFQVMGILDAKGVGAVGGHRVLGTVDDVRRIAEELDVTSGCVAIGDNTARSNVVTQIRNAFPEFEFVSIVHPRAIVAKDAVIEEGVVLLAGAIVGAGTRIGAHAIVNTGASIDHDCSRFFEPCPGCCSGRSVQDR